MNNEKLFNSKSSATKNSSIFEAISCPTGSYYEPFADSGAPTPHWQSFFDTFDARGKAALELDHERTKRMRHADGATINPFDDLTEQTSSWALDMIPFLISAREWTRVEKGIKQRLKLLENILADTYGPQDLLKSGKIAPELIFANPHFLHACHNIRPSGNRYLTFYAADIYRDPDGQFRVFRDYGVSPAGLGYALENRLVMSHVFSSLYQKTQIRRLAPFFQTFHQALIQRTSLRKNDPGIVLFSPGPDSSLYFEHALLSRYLGYPLVEGQDLTVRNGKVFLKKLAGLEPVEAIFRHVDDHNSDPFALRRRTTTGVAGLIQVCREQNIDIVNPIGSGFIETPALQSILPNVCRDLFDDDLILPDHQTWWCKDDESLNYVLSNLNTLKIIPAMDRSAHYQQSTNLFSDIKSAPWKYLASSSVAPSSTPAWSGQGLSNCFNMIRIFACATEDGFSVMPGGLSITADNIDALLDECPETQRSKDIWILSDEPVELVSLLSGLTAIPEFKRSSDLPNRVADNLLWLGRYLERAEGLVRILRCVYRRISGEDRPENVPELHFLLSILLAKQIIPHAIEAGERYNQELKQLLSNALYRKDSSESVISILRRVQETARNVRDRLSIDCTRIINRMENFRVRANYDPMDALDETLFTLSAFSGLAMESMNRGLGWRFMDMGRRVERAMNQAVLVGLALPLVCIDSHNTLQSLLEVCDSLMTYRSRYRSAFQLAPVLDLLLADEGNPKSLAFQLLQISAHVEQLPREDEKRFSSKEECIALEMLTRTRLLDLTNITCAEEAPEAVIEFLNSTETMLKAFGQEVSAHYLTRIPSTPHYTIIPNEKVS